MSSYPFYVIQNYVRSCGVVGWMSAALASAIMSVVSAMFAVASLSVAAEVVAALPAPAGLAREVGHRLSRSASVIFRRFRVATSLSCRCAVSLLSVFATHWRWLPLVSL